MIVPLIVMLFFIAWFAYLSAEFSKMRANSARLYAKYRREERMREERDRCVRYVVENETRIRNLDYVLLSKKMDGTLSPIDGHRARLERQSLSYAKKRIREIFAELGDCSYAHLTREAP